ncbi:MAG: cysteine synthase A [Kosmotoga sp.]|nr:MAG: cysteine synthase A [Kosmotoga sp.]
MNLIETIGNTPIVKLRKLDNSDNLFLKLEKNNPGGSIKDRAVLGMLLEAKKSGKLIEDVTVIEPTSGNTGISIAMLSSFFNYKAILVMPETASLERIKVMKAFGARVLLTSKESGIKGSIKKVEELLKEIKASFTLDQFNNPANPSYHELTTGPEILSQMSGEIDTFVCGTGTGGTLTGVAKTLKTFNQSIRIIAVEPSNSPVLTKGIPGKHKIQGIGPGFIPSILDRDIIDDVITVDDEEAINTMHELHKREGLLVGISTGANVAASIKLRKSGAKGNIVTIAPDHYERYLSADD